MRSVRISAWLALVLYTSSASAETALEKSVSGYAVADEAGRQALRAKIRAQDKIAVGDVAKWTAFTQKALLARGRHDGKEISTLHHKDYPISYAVIGDTKGRSMSVVILLHGGGGKEVNEMAWKSTCDVARISKPPFDLVVVPRIWSGMEASWGTKEGMEYLPAMLAELKRTYSIDTNRVYLWGSSMGGYGGCSFGAASADLFAAIGTEIAASSYGEAYRNFMNTPFAVHIGEKDTDTDRIGKARTFKANMEAMQKEHAGKYVLSWKEYPGMGHSIPPAATAEIYGWMKPLKRDPAPKSVVWQGFKDPAQKPCENRYFWWLHTEAPTAEMRIEARIGDKNVIDIKAAGASSFTVFLNDKLVDLKKPVILRLDGREVYRGTPAPSLSAIVESMAAHEDPEMVFTARIDVKK